MCPLCISRLWRVQPSSTHVLDLHEADCGDAFKKYMSCLKSGGTPPRHGMQTLTSGSRKRLKAFPLCLKKTVERPSKVFYGLVS